MKRIYFVLIVLAYGAACFAYTPSAALSYSNQSNIVIDGKSFSTGVNGAAIYLTNCNNVKITNCSFSLNSGIIGVRLAGCSNVEISGNYMENFSSGVYATGCTGGIDIHCNMFNTIAGTKPRGQMVQFNGCSGTGNRVNNNTLDTPVGVGGAEDLINFYNSYGTASDPIQCNGNKLRGGGPSTSGGGIMLGDNGSHDIVCDGNILVDPGQYGISSPSGYNIVIKNNKVYSAQHAWTNVGIYVGLASEITAGFACDGPSIQVLNNQVKWTSKTGINNGWYNCPCCPGVAQSGNNFNASINASILPATLTLNSTACGGPTATFTKTFTPQATKTYTPQNTKTRTPANTKTSTPSNTKTSTPINTKTFTPVSTVTFTGTSTNTLTATRTTTFTPLNTKTSTPGFTRTATPDNTITFTPVNTNTRTPALTFTQTETRTPTPGITTTSSSTYTRTATSTQTATRTPTPGLTITSSCTFTPAQTNTQSVTPSMTPTPAITITSSCTFMPTFTFTQTSSCSSTPSMTLTLTSYCSFTATSTQTATRTTTPGSSCTSTPTPVNTATATAVMTAIPDSEINLIDVITYPNPVIAGSSINFRMNIRGNNATARIRIYTVAGRLIRQFEQAGLDNGENNISKDSSLISGLSAGTYYYEAALVKETIRARKKGVLIILK